MLRLEHATHRCPLQFLGSPLPTLDRASVSLGVASRELGVQRLVMAEILDRQFKILDPLKAAPDVSLPGRLGGYDLQHERVTIVEVGAVDAENVHEGLFTLRVDRDDEADRVGDRVPL